MREDEYKQFVAKLPKDEAELLQIILKRTGISFTDWVRKHNNNHNNAIKKYAENESARQKLRAAVKAGKIHRKIACEKCGIEGKIEPHHTDYSKPLDVIWLCVDCHEDAHRRQPARRKQSLTIYVTPEEYMDIYEKAEALSVTRSELFVNAVKMYEG